jgi:hypothetical protein
LYGSKAQYEVQLKKWRFRKYSMRDDWLAISRLIDTRKLQGNDTDVFFDGEQVQPAWIRKETRRYQSQKASSVALEGMTHACPIFPWTSWLLDCDVVHRISQDEYDAEILC